MSTAPSRLYPLFADLAGKRVLVVGGGTVALRKTRTLLEAGAEVTVGAPDHLPALASLRVRLAFGAFDERWLDQAWLVVAATDDAQVNAAVAAACARRRVLVNVVDDLALSSFQVPAIVERGPLQIAISSAGAAPMLARALRERLETQLDESLGDLARLLAAARASIRKRLPELAARRRFFARLLEGRVPALLRGGDATAARRALDEELSLRPAPARGHVALVGAGPGDPGLLTLRALRLLNEADVILHDRLVSPEILALARKDAERIDVGKPSPASARRAVDSQGETRAARHDARAWQPGPPVLPDAGTPPHASGASSHGATKASPAALPASAAPATSRAPTMQDAIHAQMLAHARAGKFVVRLKGGDPFVFGRGGEELEFLRMHGIDYEVVPGITAAVACAAYAGIPLTHRDHAQSVRLVTAHGRDEAAFPDWPALAKDRQTLAFYMGVAGLTAVRDGLLAHGRDPGTPFALVENGTRREQRVVAGALRDLTALAAAHAVQSPALLFVGEVAALVPRLHWYGAAPLIASTTATATAATTMLEQAA